MGKKTIRVKKKKRAAGRNNGWRMNSGSRKCIPAVLHFSSLFALLSFLDLICNVEFNSGSSCLN